MAEYRSADTRIGTDCIDHDLVYTVFYIHDDEGMKKVETVANDHEDAMSQFMTKGDVRIVIKGHVDEPLWIG
jgi:hypothetical protein